MLNPQNMSALLWNTGALTYWAIVCDVILFVLGFSDIIFEMVNTIPFTFVVHPVTISIAMSTLRRHNLVCDKMCVNSVGILIESVKWYSFTGELVRITMENLRLIRKSKICFMEIDGVRKHAQFHYSSYKIRSQYIATPLFIQHHFILFNVYRSNIG